jgi:intein-encoded DNA endonuclease-like protein
MLSKNFDIDNEYFYYFLAGFFDSEGCIHVYNNHGYIGASILMYNSNKKLLEIIKKRLEKDGFHPKFYRFFKKGEKTTNNYIRGNDLWTVAMYTIKEILTLMSRMPIKHKEKIDKIKIVSSSNSNKWELIADQVNDLKMKIKKEVKEFIKP